MISRLVLISLALLISALACSTNKENLLYVQTKGGAELRQTAATNGVLLAVVPQNTAVEVKKSQSVPGMAGGRAGQWLHITYKDLDGWMFDKDLAEDPVTALKASWLCESDQYLLLNFYENGKFMMKVNLCQGIGTVYGKFTEETGRYLLAIDRRDFTGFAGANISEVAFVKSSAETLRFAMTQTNGFFSCGPWEGALYRRVAKAAQ
jgi:hypothetical protein